MTSTEADLKKLMLASLDGDAASHRALLEGLSRRLRVYYKSKLASVRRSASEAEDLVQEAVLAIYIKRHTYDPTDPFTPRVHAIARHKLIDFLRRTRTPFAEIPLDKAEETMAFDDHVGAESSYDIQRLLQRLPPGVKCSMEAPGAATRRQSPLSRWRRSSVSTPCSILNAASTAKVPKGGCASSALASRTHLRWPND